MRRFMIAAIVIASLSMGMPSQAEANHRQPVRNIIRGVAGRVVNVVQGTRNAVRNTVQGVRAGFAQAQCN